MSTDPKFESSNTDLSFSEVTDEERGEIERNLPQKILKFLDEIESLAESPSRLEVLRMLDNEFPRSSVLFKFQQKGDQIFPIKINGGYIPLFFFLDNNIIDEMERNEIKALIAQSSGKPFVPNTHYLDAGNEDDVIQVPGYYPSLFLSFRKDKKGAQRLHSATLTYDTNPYINASTLDEISSYIFYLRRIGENEEYIRGFNQLSSGEKYLLVREILNSKLADFEENEYMKIFEIEEAVGNGLGQIPDFSQEYIEALLKRIKKINENNKDKKRNEPLISAKIDLVRVDWDEKKRRKALRTLLAKFFKALIDKKEEIIKDYPILE